VFEYLTSLLIQIRAPDGLLQRYLSERGDSSAGMMQRYWFEGNNYNFVLLLSQVSQACLYRQILLDADHTDEDDELDKATKFLRPSHVFWTSFSDDVHHLWNYISMPFHRASKQEIKDFIVDDDGDVATSSFSPRLFDVKSAIEEHAANKATAAYFSKYDDNENSDESRDIIDNSELIFEESADDDDEWEQEIRGKRESKLHRKSNEFKVKREKSHQRITTKRESSSSPADLYSDSDVKDTSASGRSGNRYVLKDSDDETPPPTASSAQSDVYSKNDGTLSSPSVKRRLVIKESDEE
jgi:ElaB/YqjD/DUF883 family membrane-anchored ribosome-binding protein